MKLGGKLVMLPSGKFYSMEQIVDPRQFILIPDRYSDKASPPIQKGAALQIVEHPWDKNAFSRFLQTRHPAMHPNIYGPLSHAAA
jgi:hypothetical protein